MSVAIEIDGKRLQVEPGMNVLEAALQNGIYIPHLCHHPDLPDIGSCRLCIVEVAGEEGVQPACKLTVREGLRVTTDSLRIAAQRKLAMELLLAAHPEDCSTCPKYGRCELQTLIQYMGVSATRMHTRVKGFAQNNQNPLIIHDMNRCVLCGRCVRACNDLRGVGVLQYNKKDMETYVGTLHDKLLKDAGCRFCGACAEVCPTGTIRDIIEYSPVEKRDALIPCQATCPAHTDVPRYVRFVKEGKFSEALAVIHEKLPFPECLGHVCAHPCESECRRGQVNEAVSIRNIKRYAAEHGNNDLWKQNSKHLPATGKKVCVVGGGPSGMTAAYYLAKQGHDVTLKEAYPTLGGQMAYGIPSYRLPREVVAKEAAYFKESEATWHIVKPENGVIGPRAAGAMVKVLTQRAKELGCDILTETPATKLIVENGKVCGAVAVDKDGNGLEVRGKAVLVATGGFGNNPEMIEKEFGLHIGQDYFPFRIPGITGDGLKMMWEVGAEKFGQNIEAIYQLPDNLNWFLLDAVLRQPNLMINQLGDRFMNEGDLGNTTYAGNAIALQPGNYGYCIMDEGILKQYKKNGPDIVDIVHPAEAFLNFEGQAKLAVEQGYEAYFEAETVPELAEKLGIDADKLQQTLDDYNAMCRCGVDSQFHKPQKYLHPITGKGKYLVGKYYLGAYGTVGGVRVNKYCEVLNKDHLPIEGLYSAGSDANTLYGDSYNFTLPGNSMGFAVNSGRMAGEAIGLTIMTPVGLAGIGTLPVQIGAAMLAGVWYVGVILNIVWDKLLCLWRQHHPAGKE